MGLSLIEAQSTLAWGEGVFSRFRSPCRIAEVVTGLRSLFPCRRGDASPCPGFVLITGANLWTAPLQLPCGCALLESKLASLAWYASKGWPLPSLIQLPRKEAGTAWRVVESEDAGWQIAREILIWVGLVGERIPARDILGYPQERIEDLSDVTKRSLELFGRLCDLQALVIPSSVVLMTWAEVRTAFAPGWAEVGARDLVLSRFAGCRLVVLNCGEKPFSVVPMHHGGRRSDSRVWDELLGVLEGLGVGLVVLARQPLVSRARARTWTPDYRTAGQGEGVASFRRQRPPPSVLDCLGHTGDRLLGVLTQGQEILDRIFRHRLAMPTRFR